MSASSILDRVRDFFARFRSSSSGSSSKTSAASLKKRLLNAAAAGRLRQQLRAELPYRIRAGRVRVRLPGVKIPAETVEIRPRLTDDDDLRGLNGPDDDSMILS